MSLRLQSVVPVISLISAFFLPYGWILVKSKNDTPVINNPLALAGRKVYENSGCNACHTRYVRKNLEDLIRYAPDEYAKVHVKSTATLAEKVDVTGLRIGPDLEYLPYALIDQDYFTRYLSNPRSLYKNSIMPSYVMLFQEKLRHDEIFFAPGSLKNNPDYSIYTRGDALLYYLKVSTLNFYGRSP